MTKRGAHSIAKEVDQWLYLGTGKHLRDLGKRAVELYGEDVLKVVEKLITGWGAAVAPVDSPYTVLGLLPDASDAVVKASFRALAFEYHPDTGKTPNVLRYQQVVESHDIIVLARKILKEKKEAVDHA